MYIFNGGRDFFAGSTQNLGPMHSSWIRWFEAKNTGKRINVSEVGGLWMGKWGDMSPQCRKACGEIVRDSKVPTNMPEKYCIGSVKAWKHRCWFFFFNGCSISGNGSDEM